MISVGVERIGRAVSRRLGPDSAVVRTLRPAYQATLNALALGRGVSRSINGAPCRIDARYGRVLQPRHEWRVAEFIRPRVRAGDVCFDVGANVGLYALQFPHWAGASGRVVAFEPNPIARTVLERHLRMNALQRSVRVAPCAVGATEGIDLFYACEADGQSRFGAPSARLAARSRALATRLTTLDAFCRGGSAPDPDWLIVDVEGFEALVLEGATELFARRGAALQVVVEMHPGDWAAVGVSRERMEAALARIGRRAVALGGQADPLGDYGHVYLEPEPTTTTARE